ncbi:hypothetical protein G6R29_05065 [Fructobacillus sp. M2-14]|uniref:Antitoxin SocA-like Panacea domain-containing protein n=1 Tax=Fructobacillus broussonetiae TaxID=2713173 RepID=A0ABS5R0L4_9LACO|nr:type II toxin-antitoxin system antitoxin SocA domain-containing protein [Fructobacillus broussonetiae]MBS9338989.1 hypothetical protein [Fructobacillus broussonetiae]
MKQLAKHIIAVANKHYLPITNLQLQKIMYFSVKKSLKEKLIPFGKIEELNQEPFFVWRYGPVSKAVYNHYHVYGAAAIVELNDEVAEFNCLNSYILELLRTNVFTLIKQTHKEKFWLENQVNIDGWRSNVIYPLEVITK